MKVLIIGFISFSIWSVIATNIYVCMILGLCNEPETIQIDESELSETNDTDSLEVTLLQQAALAPKDINIYFAFDKSEFYSDSTSDNYLNKSIIYLNENTQAKINIIGHTDAIGSDEYNQALGYRRAQCIQLYFESNGVPSADIVIESKGEKNPADVNTTPAGRANNRRTEITIKR
jgi:outer membrane protein OmpA-like peptidoglycan-associated protein